MWLDCFRGWMMDDAFDRLRREICEKEMNNVAYRYKNFLCARKENKKKRKYKRGIETKGNGERRYFFFKKYKALFF